MILKKKALAQLRAIEASKTEQTKKNTKKGD